ncbi:MAG TPA: Mur ligase domain-containing protein, partial [Longimicrobiales bacterium]
MTGARPALDLRELSQRRPVHFMGVSGAGMSALAELVLRSGGKATGCDTRPGVAAAALATLGLEVAEGHDPSHVEGAAAVVVTAAVPPDHPELVAARAKGIPVLKRAEALGAVVNRGLVVAVAGTHGKTTTTSMLARAFQHCGADPSFAIGADLNEPGSNAHDGAGELFVAEADESDESFLLLSPHAAIVTNIEADHLNHYDGLEQIHEAFEKFAGRIASGG